MALNFARERSHNFLFEPPMALSSPARLRAAVLPHGLARQVLCDTTINALRRKSPEFSAGAPLARWQRGAPLAFVLVVAVILVVWPRAAWSALATLLAIPFLLVVLLRIAAIIGLSFSRQTSLLIPSKPLCDAALPTYTILAPMYREATVAPELVRALAALDYPISKLEVMFLIEEDDEETRASLAAAMLQPHMRIVIVPQGFPRTKPRALTYGLQAAAGDLIAIFDAEDIPERAQLRKAAAAFLAADETLACVQARLGAYNPRESWLSRQFTIEYAALFEAILPTLERIRFPIPLGGTSNHFRRACLIDVGAWDPYNLTEDADLGLRLARRGYRVSMLDATTWEEAPASWSVWLGQRTRWIKGWTQTYLVHMRHPGRLWGDLGAWGFLGVHVTLGASILSALVHPWFYVVIAVGAATGESVMPVGDPLWQASLFLLVSGYITGVALPALTVARRRSGALSLAAVWHPIYWLAISIAAYRAMLDLILRPYYWEKTPHRGAAVTRRKNRPSAHSA